MINSTSVIIPVGLLVAPFGLFLSSCVLRLLGVHVLRMMCG